MKITVTYLINDTVCHKTYSAERITTQHFPSGRFQVQLWQDGKIAQYVGFRHAEHFHIVERDLTPGEDAV
jgi:hypothetical protein